MSLTEELRSCARQAGADVFGIASIERFDELPREKHPRVIFPETQSVIVLGRRIPRGALRGVEEGTNFTNYSLYGYDWLDNRFTSLTTYQVGEFLEEYSRLGGTHHSALVLGAHARSLRSFARLAGLGYRLIG